MKLSRSDYNKIEESYNIDRLNAQRELKKRTNEILLKFPRIKEINQSISQLYLSVAKKRLSNNRSNSKENLINEALLNKLNTEKETILKSNGYDPSYLDIEYKCPICKDTGYVDGVRCECFKRKIYELISSQDGTFLSDHITSFNDFKLDYYDDTYKVDKSNKTAKDYATEAVDLAVTFSLNFENNNDNLLIIGNTGVGKTLLCTCIANSLIKKGYSVVYLSSIEMFNQISDYKLNKIEPFEIEKKHANRLLVEQLYNCDLLIIDDLGSESVNGFVSSELFNIINLRLSRNLSTIISTNLNPKDIKNTYSERIFSRIVKSYDKILLIGDDLRIKLNNKGE